MEKDKLECMRECLYQQFMKLSELTAEKDNICEFADAIKTMMGIYSLLVESKDSNVL